MRPLILTLPVIALMTLAAYAEGPATADLDLPRHAQELRDAGVPADQVREALHAQRDADVKAEDASEALHAEKERIDKGEKPMENFGAFVKGKVAEGVRGKDLAAAIHAEHAARGMGGPPEGKGPDGEHGKPEDAGKDGEHGKPDDHAEHGEHGKPDDHGEHGEHGKPDGAGKPGKEK